MQYLQTNQARVEAFLAHYASEYYDPVKAREYYLRTRELKGRRQAEGTSSTPKRKLDKGEIEARKNELAREEEKFASQTERLRQKADQERARILAKLESFLKAPNKKGGALVEAEYKQIGNQLKAAISMARASYAETRTQITKSYE